MSLTFQIESVEQTWNEVMVLAQQHWAGTRSYRRHEPFNPSFDRYHACNQSGFFQLFTAREGAQLVGYFGVYITDSMHSQKRMATEDTFFIHPDYRQGRNAIRFIRHIEAQCRAWGAQEIMFSCEVENPVANKLLRYLDYDPVIVQYSKHLAPIIPADSGRSDKETSADVCT